MSWREPNTKLRNPSVTVSQNAMFPTSKCVRFAVHLPNEAKLVPRYPSSRKRARHPVSVVAVIEATTLRSAPHRHRQQKKLTCHPCKGPWRET